MAKIDIKMLKKIGKREKEAPKLHLGDSGVQGVSKSEPAPAATTTGVDAEQLTPEQEKLIESIDDELLHPTEVKDSDVQTLKISPRRTETEQPTVGTGDGTQTADAGTKTSGEGQPTGETRNNAQVTDTETHPDADAAKPKPGETQTTQSGGDYKPADYAKKAAKDQNLSSSERQMYGRLGNMRANAQKVFDKGTDEQIKNELGRWGIETRKGAKAADYMNDIDEILKKKAESGPTIGDKFRAHHGVGLTGLGVVGVSTLDLANSRGQQSNAQLYSDPFA